MRQLARIATLAALAWGLLLSTASAAPTVSPGFGGTYGGTAITITGTGLELPVTIGGTAATIAYSSPTEIRAYTPAQAQTGPQPIQIGSEEAGTFVYLTSNAWTLNGTQDFQTHSIISWGTMSLRIDGTSSVTCHVETAGTTTLNLTHVELFAAYNCTGTVCPSGPVLIVPGSDLFPDTSGSALIKPAWRGEAFGPYVRIEGIRFNMDCVEGPHTVFSGNLLMSTNHGMSAALPESLEAQAAELHSPDSLAPLSVEGEQKVIGYDHQQVVGFRALTK